MSTAVDDAPDQDQGTPVAQDHADELELLVSGRARLWIDGQAYTIRAPKVGEYKSLRQIVLDAQEEGASAAREIPPRVVDPISALEQFLLDTFKTLGERKLPSKESWPSWMLSTDLQAMLLQHWRTVPLAPGSKEILNGS